MRVISPWQRQLSKMRCQEISQQLSNRYMSGEEDKPQEPLAGPLGSFAAFNANLEKMVFLAVCVDRHVIYGYKLCYLVSCYVVHLD